MVLGLAGPNPDGPVAIPIKSELRRLREIGKLYLMFLKRLIEQAATILIPVATIKMPW